jgi:hypothetical protein
VSMTNNNKDQKTDQHKNTPEAQQSRDTKHPGLDKANKTEQESNTGTSGKSDSEPTANRPK